MVGEGELRQRRRGELPQRGAQEAAAAAAEEREAAAAAEERDGSGPSGVEEDASDEDGSADGSGEGKIARRAAGTYPTQNSTQNSWYK